MEHWSRQEAKNTTQNHQDTVEGECSNSDDRFRFFTLSTQDIAISQPHTTYQSSVTFSPTVNTFSQGTCDMLTESDIHSDSSVDFFDSTPKVSCSAKVINFGCPIKSSHNDASLDMIDGALQEPNSVLLKKVKFESDKDSTLNNSPKSPFKDEEFTLTSPDRPCCDNLPIIDKVVGALENGKGELFKVVRKKVNSMNNSPTSPFKDEEFTLSSPDRPCCDNLPIIDKVVGALENGKGELFKVVRKKVNSKNLKRGRTYDNNIKRPAKRSKHPKYKDYLSSYSESDDADNNSEYFIFILFNNCFVIAFIK